MNQVQRLIDSGVQPLELYYQSVVSAEFGAPAAYRSQLRLSDPELGVLLPEQYLPVALRTVQSEELAWWNLVALMDAVDVLMAQGATFDWLSMYVPTRLLLKSDMAAKAARLLSERGFLYPGKLLFEFPEELLYEEADEVSPRLEALREMGFQTAVRGFGSPFSPTMRLSYFKTNYVMMDEYVASHLEEGTASAACGALINFALDSGAAVVLDGGLEALLSTAYRHNVYGLTGKISGRYKKLATLLKKA